MSELAGATLPFGPDSDPGDVHFRAAVKGKADIKRADLQRPYLSVHA